MSHLSSAIVAHAEWGGIHEGKNTGEKDWQ
jgi:hypothetical protein